MGDAEQRAGVSTGSHAPAGNPSLQFAVCISDPLMAAPIDNDVAAELFPSSDRHAPAPVA